MRRSHHSAISSPPARHQPDTAAIVGFDGMRREKPSGPPGPSAAGRTCRCALRSAPAQNATSPAPVMTSTRASSSASKRSTPVGEQLGGGAVHRVAALLAVDREHRGGPAPLVADGLAHRRLPARALLEAGLLGLVLAALEPALDDRAEDHHDDTKKSIHAEREEGDELVVRLAEQALAVVALANAGAAMSRKLRSVSGSTRVIRATLYRRRRRTDPTSAAAPRSPAQYVTASAAARATARRIALQADPLSRVDEPARPGCAQ